VNGNYEVILIGLNPYQFEDEKTGRQIEGTKAHYAVIGEDLPNGVGLNPTSTRLDYQDFGKYSDLTLPCFATLHGQVRLSNMKFEASHFDNFRPLAVSQKSEKANG